MSPWWELFTRLRVLHSSGTQIKDSQVPTDKEVFLCGL